MAKYQSNSRYDTRKIALKLAKKEQGRVFALTGELGAGKTIFVQGFAKGLGITEKIISPTFVLIRQHKIPNTKKVLFHIDLYRIKDVSGLGLPEILSDPNNVVLIEWAEKIKELPENSIKIKITKDGDQKRIITIS